MNPFSANKLLKHLDRVVDMRNGKLPPPVLVELSLTNLCNHACPECTFSYLVNVDKSTLTMELAERVVDELSAAGVRAVTFTGGGEPLLFGEDRVLSLMRRAESDVALITNGSLLRDGEFLRVCEWVRVSLDGYDEATYRRFHGRGGAEFDKVCDNIAAMSEEQDRCTLGVAFLVDSTSLDRDDVWCMAEFAEKRFPSIDYLQFRPMVTNMVKDPSLSGGGCPRGMWKEVERHVTVASVGRPFGVLASESKFEALSEQREYSSCLGHFLHTTVAADGCVYVCCHTQGQPEFKLGDLREESFSDVWQPDRLAKVISSFDPRDVCPPACVLDSANKFLHAAWSDATHENFI